MNIKWNHIYAKIVSFFDNVNAIYTDFAAFLERYEHSATTYAGIANGGTAGRLQLGATIMAYRIGGTLYGKSATDNLWNLSGETATTSGQYRAYYLYLNASGTASIEAGSNAASANAAIAALPAIPSDKAIIGVYVAGPSTNFANALAAQGTIYNGWPSAQTLTSAAMTKIGP